MLAALGFSLSLARIREDCHRLLLIWTAVLLIPLGILSPFPATAVSRLQFLAVPLALMAGFATAHIWETLMQAVQGGTRRWIGVCAVSLLILLILSLNVHHFWIESPKRWHLTPEAVAVRLIHSGNCSDDVGTIMVAGSALNALLLPALRSYYPQGDIPRLVYDDGLASIEPTDLEGISCIVFTHVDMPESRRLQAKIMDHFPSARLDHISDISGKTTVGVVYLK